MFGATWLHVSDYRNFWSTERSFYGSLEINRLALIKQLFPLQKRLPKWHQRFVKTGFQKPSFLSKK